jgi:hypothetical protein
MSVWRSLVGETVQRSSRCEFRHPASGRVTILLYQDAAFVPARIEGELVDRSRHGCRISHHFGDMQIAQQVTLILGSFQTDAVVVWTKACGEFYESGFSFTH